LVKEIEGQKIYVKVKIRLDYYIADENFKVVDINFEKNTINGFLDLEKTEINQY
jgi:ABC-type polysaccharide/polyol phosphate transport system ATPase subunit